MDSVGDSLSDDDADAEDAPAPDETAQETASGLEYAGPLAPADGLWLPDEIDSRGSSWLRRFQSVAAPEAALALGETHPGWTEPARDLDRDAGLERPLSLSAQEALLPGLERMHRDLKDDGNHRDGAGALHAAVEVVGIAFSGALVATALRSSALFAAALSSLPIWRRMDPLMVLGLSEEERRKLEEQQRAAHSEEGSHVGRVLDGGKTLRSDPG